MKRFRDKSVCIYFPLSQTGVDWKPLRATRGETVQQLCEAQKHILVVTDYLSEGINLPVLICFGYHSKRNTWCIKYPPSELISSCILRVSFKYKSRTLILAHLLCANPAGRVRPTIERIGYPVRYFQQSPGWIFLYKGQIAFSGFVKELTPQILLAKYDELTNGSSLDQGLLGGAK